MKYLAVVERVESRPVDPPAQPTTDVVQVFINGRYYSVEAPAGLYHQGQTVDVEADGYGSGQVLLGVRIMGAHYDFAQTKRYRYQPMSYGSYLKLQLLCVALAVMVGLALTSVGITNEHYFWPRQILIWVIIFIPLFRYWRSHR